MPRGRPRKNTQTIIIEKSQDEKDLAEMPLDSFEDYHEYNRKCRKLGIPVKIPPLSMHKYVKAKITRLDGQGMNGIRVRKRDQYIDYDAMLQPGVTLDIPERIADWLPTLSYPQYKQVTHEDGSAETVKTHSIPRYSVQIVKRGIDGNNI